MPRSRRRYSDAERAAIVAAVKAEDGNAARVAESSGIPERTIRNWVAGIGVIPPDLAAEKAEDLAAMMDRIARRAVGYIDLAFDAMDAAKTRNGDSMTGVMALDRLSELNRIAGTAVDKTQLLSGGATARIEHDVVIDAGDDGRD